MSRYTPARARRLSECDSESDYNDELDKQESEDEFDDRMAEWWSEED